MRLKTTVPRIPHPAKFLKRPVRIDKIVVGEIVSVVADSKDPSRLVVEAEVTEHAAKWLAAHPEKALTIDGIR